MLSSSERQKLVLLPFSVIVIDSVKIVRYVHSYPRSSVLSRVYFRATLKIGMDRKHRDLGIDYDLDEHAASRRIQCVPWE
jgi:hypothetical protein